MRILGIETSCDETAAAVVEVTRGQFSVLSNVVASQVKIHAQTGGVVPEVAARAHVERIVPVVEEALRCAANGIELRAKSKKLYALRSTLYALSIDAVAVTAGPGLMTSLLVGVEIARTLAWLWKKPLVAVNHLAGHVYANFLPPQKIRSKEQRAKSKNLDSTPYALSSMQFPVLALIVSGGHTELVLMRKHLDFKVIGATRDDAAGEAFDKVAKMLNLGYPGGPAIAAEAAKFHQLRHPERSEESRANARTSVRDPSPRPSVGAQDDTFGVNFPRPMIDSPDFDFSFSGLKTAVLYHLKSENYLQQNNVRPDIKMLRGILPKICYEFQEAAVEVLVAKTVRAAKQYKVKTVLLGGGVAANARLRQRLVEAIKRDCLSSVIRLPPLQYTTDNAAMIAAAGYFITKAKQFTPWQKLDVDPNWALGKPQKSLI